MCGVGGGGEGRGPAGTKEGKTSLDLSAVESFGCGNCFAPSGYNFVEFPL